MFPVAAPIPPHSSGRSSGLETVRLHLIGVRSCIAPIFIVLTRGLSEQRVENSEGGRSNVNPHRVELEVANFLVINDYSEIN